MSMEAQQLMKFLKMVQKMLIHHQYTIETIKETLGDSAIVTLSTAQRCEHSDCEHPSTVRHSNHSSHLCDRHLAEKIMQGSEKEEEWDDLHYADCIRNLYDYADAKEQHDRAFSIH
jgi:hypothetical protein